MKHIPGIFLVSLFMLTAVDLRAATDTTVEQVMTVSITESYLSTNLALGTTTIKTATITTATVVKALAFQIGNTNLVNAQLLHIIDLTATNTESIILRKTGYVDTDVTAHFGGLGTNFWSSGDTNQSALTANIARTGVQEPTLNKTNVADSLNSLSLTTDNLSFSLTNGYGTSFYFNKVTGTATKVTNVWANISCSGGVNLYTNNIGVWTNAAKFTNAVGPAHGMFSTSSGTFKAN